MKNKTIALCIAQAGSAYDFTVYAFLAPILTSVFFPHKSHFVSLVFIFSIFFIGFLARPIGGALFGHFGDKGNKHLTVSLSIFTLGFPTLVMAFLPSYQTIGSYAPLLLLILRILQGLALGGEFTGMMLILSEEAPKNRKYIYTSFVWTGSLLGTLISSTIIAVMHHWLSPAEMEAWGWRIPFLFGLILILTGIYLRYYLGIKQGRLGSVKHSEFPLVTIFKKHKKHLLKIILANMQMIALTYFSIIFYPTYLVKYLHLSAIKASGVSEFTLILLICLIPPFALLADRINGRKLLYFSTITLILVIYPLLTPIKPNVTTIYLIQTVLVILTAATLSALPYFLVITGNVKINYSLISIPYNITASLIGGSLPLLSTLLIKWSGDLAYLSIYIGFLSCLTLSGIVSLQPSKSRQLQ